VASTAIGGVEMEVHSQGFWLGDTTVRAYAEWRV